jgi:CDP-paratose 2-epimerase
MKAIINRCGVVTGPGQFGKVDQGVFTFWVACHFFKRPLRYTGFGGKGKQVRDLLHPRDLFFLLLRQIERFDDYPGCVFNVGGGKQMSVSLREFTDLCEEVTGNRITIESDPKTTSVDIPYYVSDMRYASKCFAWQPKISLREITEAIFNWVRENEVCLKPIFC